MQLTTEASTELLHESASTSGAGGLVTVHVRGRNELEPAAACERNVFRLPATQHGASSVVQAQDLRWLPVLSDGLRHEPLLLEAGRGGRVVGRLPLAFVRSRLFGRFLVSLPYINSAGVSAEDPQVAAVLIDRAVELTGEMDCRYLELRHESRLPHPELTAELTTKVHMRLVLPGCVGELWDGLKAKVRNQVRKGQQQGFSVEWGREELLADFYAVFSRNMRDLGTPVYGRPLFRAILRHFADEAELCVLRDAARPVAAALLVHGRNVTEVPSAGSLREYGPSNANMLMYWHLLARSVERGGHVFDFGRSTADGPHYRFKKQWGAEPHPAVWQYFVRRGSIDALRPESSRNRRLVRAWQKLPVWLTRCLGPGIVRGIP